MLTIDRSHCGQRVFGGCGADCDRQCSATVWIPPSKTPLGRQMLKQSRLTLWMVLAALIPAIALIGFGAAAVAEQGMKNIKAWEIAHEPV